MQSRPTSPLTRRRFLGVGLALAAATFGLAAGRTLPAMLSGSPAASAAQVQELPPAATCSGAVTPAQTEGPYYKAGSPVRASLIEPGMPGTRLVVTGYVLAKDCQPIAGAWLDFWQADANGSYDNRGYTVRGHQFTDAEGRYSLETVVPGEYPGRTPHIHVKVQAPNQPVLTTQVYFPDQPGNSRDGIFNSALLLAVQDAPDAKQATFNFLLSQS